MSFDTLLEDRKLYYDSRAEKVPGASLEELFQDLYKHKGYPFSYTNSPSRNRKKRMYILQSTRTVPRHTWRTQRMRAMRIRTT